MFSNKMSVTQSLIFPPQNLNQSQNGLFDKWMVYLSDKLISFSVPSDGSQSY